MSPSRGPIFTSRREVLEAVGLPLIDAPSNALLASRMGESSGLGRISR